MNKMNMQKLKAVGVGMLAGFLGCGIMLILPGMSDSTAAMVGAWMTVVGWKTVMSRLGKA